MPPPSASFGTVPRSPRPLFAAFEGGEALPENSQTINPDVRLATDGAVTDNFSPRIDDRLLDVYARVSDPSDPIELRDLYLARVEYELGTASHRPELAARWTTARRQRTVSAEEVLHSRATFRFVKELFNWFFREDLYGDLRSHSHIVLSSGSVDEELYGLPEALKECIQYALARDWYGYSDSRGRVVAREAIARYESARAGQPYYDESNVAITLGGTFAMYALADFIALRGGIAGAALCAIPNYPPLVESIARRMPVALVSTPCVGGTTSLVPLIEALTPSTPLIMLQTVTNPTGAPVDELHLEHLIKAASPSTIVLLDECHECIGPQLRPTPMRMARNVVRLSSLSKTWSAPGLKLGWILASADFIDDYYEYASTSFGGPPSLFFTLLEVMARMERWLIEGIDAPGRNEFAEFEASYGLTIERLAAAYASYRHERVAREMALVGSREAAVAGFAGPATIVVRPRYSINMALEFVGVDDSYRCFRTMLADTGVAVFPGILTFCLGGGAIRVTTGRARSDLRRAIDRLARWDGVHLNESGLTAGAMGTPLVQEVQA